MWASWERLKYLLRNGRIRAHLVSKLIPWYHTSSHCRGPRKDIDWPKAQGLGWHCQTKSKPWTVELLDEPVSTVATGSTVPMWVGQRGSTGAESSIWQWAPVVRTCHYSPLAGLDTHPAHRRHGETRWSVWIGQGVRKAVQNCLGVHGRATYFTYLFNFQTWRLSET